MEAKDSSRFSGRKPNRAKSACQSQISLLQVLDAALDLVLVEPEQFVFLDQQAPARLLPFRWKVAQSAENPVAETPGNQIIPESLLLGLDELDQRRRIWIFPERQWLRRVSYSEDLRA